QGKPEPLAAQNQLQRDPVLGCVDALLATAGWRQHALFFVEANGTGGDIQLAGQVGNAVGLFRHAIGHPSAHSGYCFAGTRLQVALLLFEIHCRLLCRAFATREPLGRPRILLMRCPAATSKSRSIPVSMPKPLSMYTTSSLATLPVAPLA